VFFLDACMHMCKYEFFEWFWMPCMFDGHKFPFCFVLDKYFRTILQVLDRFEGQTFTCEYKYDGERAQVCVVICIYTYTCTQFSPYVSAREIAHHVFIDIHTSYYLSKSFRRCIYSRTVRSKFSVGILKTIPQNTLILSQ